MHLVPQLLCEVRKSAIPNWDCHRCASAQIPSSDSAVRNCECEYSVPTILICTCENFVEISFLEKSFRKVLKTANFHHIKSE